MKEYLSNLRDQLKNKSISSGVFIMQSNGGVIHTDTAIENPARTVLSGPAGGALAGMMISNMTQQKNLITIDMGGTSLDTCLIDNGELHFTTMSNIGGMPIKLPMVEMHTIGSGGGSIAFIDSGGALRVGPQSAGAVPGPVCYRRGGAEPTVTDANVVLGRLNPSYLLGGEMSMDVDAAQQVIEQKIAKPLGISIEEAAEGILRVVNANIVRGIHVVSVEKGYDPRDFSLVAFGGAGPVNAVDIGMELDCQEIIVPQHPGITSAVGMLTADVKHDYVQTYMKNFQHLDVDELNQMYAKLEEQAVQDLLAKGFSQKSISLLRSVELRYKGQAYEISVPVNNVNPGDAHINKAVQYFHESYKKLYGYNREEEQVELVNIRLNSIGHISNVVFSNKELSKKPDHLLPFEKRDVYFDGQFVPTPIYDRQMLRSGQSILGPAVVEQLDSTIVIYPDQKSMCDSFGNLIIKRQHSSPKGEVGLHA